MFKLVVFSMLLAVATAGVVSPIGICGSSWASVLQLRITGCSGAPPCLIIPNEEYRIETDFSILVPRWDSRFELTVTTTSGQTFPISDHRLGPLVPGRYTAGQTIRASTALSGQTVVGQLRILGILYDGRAIICIEVAMKVQ